MNVTAKSPARRSVFLGATVLLATASLMLSGCTADNATTKPTGSGTAAAGKSSLKLIEMINPAPGAAGWQIIAKCFSDEAKKEGIPAKVVGASGTNFDVPATLDLFQQAVADGANAIAINTSGGAPTFEPVIQQARSKGVLVSTMTSGDATAARNFDIGLDIVSFADMVAKRIQDRKGHQNVGILTINLTGTSKIFLDEVQKDLAKDSNVTFVATVADNGDATQDVNLVGDMLTAHPDINYVITDNVGQVAGVATAIREHNLIGKTFTVGNSLDPNTEAALDSGIADAILVQKRCDIGRDTVDNYVALAEGKSVPKSIPTQMMWATKSSWHGIDQTEWR